jgi:hypothetical protein
MQFGYIIENMQTIDEALEKLKHSRFRSSFHLGQRELAYTKAKGECCSYSTAAEKDRESYHDLD